MDAVLYYRPKLLQVGELKGAFEQAVSAVLGSNAQITVDYPRHRAGVRDNVRLDAESLRAVVDLNKINFTLYASLPGSFLKHIQISCQTDAGVLRMIAIGEESFQCQERLALNLGLDETEQPEDQSVLAFENLESRVLALEKAARDAERTLKCFISFKFDDAQTISQVEHLKRVLTAVHIEWVTGEQFEPRRIEDKVKARLRADIDFVIAIISKAGESKWIRDELADANSRGLWIVLLLEQGASFDKGIFGTLEYIPYDLAIGQTFPALLEGINFIRAEISTKGEHHKG